MNRIIVTGIFLFFIISVFAQSDYEKIQNFKEKIKTFETEIENADSIGQLEDIMTRLEAYKRKTVADRDLLNKALYPEDYDKSFENINKKLRITIENKSRIEGLSEEVETAQNLITKLKKEITEISESETKLRIQNNALYSEIMRLKGNPVKDKATIDSLNELTAKLKDVILKRDVFIADVVDSIFTTSFQRYENMSSADQANLLSTIKSSNLLERIKELIGDNITIIEKNLFLPEDLNEFKAEQKRFSSNWKKFGSSLVDIYSSQNESRNDLYAVDFMLSEWDNKINEKIWFEVHNIFDKNNIQLERFNSGEEFEKVISDYIKSELDSSNVSDEVERVKNFSFFYDDVWQKEISENWIPLLIKNELLTQIQKENIDSLINKWADEINGVNITWIYILLIIVLIVIINIWNSKRLKAKKEEETN